MPYYSAIFQGYLRFRTISSIPFLSGFHLPSRPRPRPTLTSRLRPRVPSCSVALELDNSNNHRRVGAGFTQRTVTLPFWPHQTSGYGRFAYEDVSTDDDSDVEFPSSRNHSHTQLQPVCSIYLLLYFTRLCAKLGVCFDKCLINFMSNWFGCNWIWSEVVLYLDVFILKGSLIMQIFFPTQHKSYW